MMWKMIDKEREQTRLSEVHFQNSILSNILSQEKLKHWKVEPNHDAFLSLGGQVGRSMLISWVLDACTSHKLKPSTTCLAVNYLDRMISKGCVGLDRAQRIANVCIRLAVKLDSVGGDSMQVPTFGEVIPSAKMELFVLDHLKWRMHVPTVYSFLKLFADEIWLPPPSRDRAFEYAKRIFVYVECQMFNPSAFAMICIFLLQQDDLLPLPCKALSTALLREGKVDVDQVANGFKRFRHVCFSADCSHVLNRMEECGHIEEEDESSSATAYPESMSSRSSGDLEFHQHA